MKNRILLTALFLLSSLSANAAPLDLSGWSALTLDFAGGQPAGTWVLDGGNTGVTQTTNADPSFYLNNLNQTNYSIDGSWEVQTASDNDYMGFVFGYQNSSNFYLFDWKQGSQNYSGATANEGMSLKKFEGTTGDGLVDLSLGEFWNNSAATFGDMTVLDTNHSATAGWANNVVYDFHLDFLQNPGEIHVIVKNGATTLWDTTVFDNTFSSGEFGFYNYSQELVHYAGFEQTGGVVVPEPSALFILGLGLMGFGLRRRKRVITSL